jgi:competence protein ComEC
VRIDRYEYDPAGSDTENANDEWVVLANRDKDTVMLGGWILRDESTQNRFVLPDGFRLSHGDEVKIHSGCGIATATDLYWCAADPVWSNGGDTIILQLPDGTIVAWEQFDGKF